MSKTKKEVDRILKHMQKICQVSEWMLQKLEMQDADLMLREQRILEALAGGDLAQQDRFIKNAANRLKSIAEERERLLQAQLKVGREYSRQRKMLQTMEDRLTVMMVANARRDDERVLGELLDRMFARKETQASRKAGILEYF